MKKIIKYTGLIAIATTLFYGCTLQTYSTLSTQSATVTFQSFYDDLMPYGTWMDYPGYGQVWHPRVEEEFRPYVTRGHWMYSNEGWAWVSDYNWGWAPFHYGRWMYDDFYGWLWVPGYEWSPAWVTWGNVDDYYAWAPLLPEVNVSIQFNLWKPNIFYWNICPRKNIYDRNLHFNVHRPDRVPDFNNRISIFNNFNLTRVHKQYYSKGPERAEVERYSNQSIGEVILKNARKVAQVAPAPNTSERKVFRPKLQQDNKPREYKRVENDRVNPIRNNDQKPAAPPTEQKRNIEKLPVYKHVERPARTPEPQKNNPDQPKKQGKKIVPF